MKTSSVSATIAFLLTVAFGAPLGAGETPSPTPYSGDIWRRSTLSGDWWGGAMIWRPKASPST
jgi:hypothetical protein